MRHPVRTLTGWARYPRAESRLVCAETPDRLPELIAGCTDYVARGNGRAYGDAAIGLYQTLAMRGLDRFRTFDPPSGLLTVEAGVLLADILSAFVPRGYFPAVVPGTQYVTVGGMIAADVHGKNHHRDGGMGNQIDSFVLLLPEGIAVRCSREAHPELFAATIGGMGLTGTIVEATLRLRPIESGWIRQSTIAAPDLAGLTAALDESADASYSVAWVDCLSRGAALGRGLVFLGEHASFADTAHLRSLSTKTKAGLAVPLDLPPKSLNRLSIGAFNTLYYNRGASRVGAPRYIPWNRYFFPLDGLRDWNRLYGRRGFVQHQCVIPAADSAAILPEILDRVARLGCASPLAVLKHLGTGNGLLSFPMKGYTLTLDLPATPTVFTVLDAIDRLVAISGGRLYLAKDSRQARETFEAGYSNLNKFRELRRSIGAESRLTSHLSARLGI
ncbi:MAG: FAD-binding oxidoreductase [Methylobacterium sp.]|uniref:FAD-binding oxidoreductase n=1 Tax=Methylobacterium sp. TaxID=409 RepID=UPI0025DC07B1|nr:FAD-binding oxidoreductase [Methylobacterium sp.]MBX9934337.1 FAD-binding oxidoreductase [Methylobacterium sp.]